jgi:hypothetical protein
MTEAADQPPAPDRPAGDDWPDGPFPRPWRAGGDTAPADTDTPAGPDTAAGADESRPPPPAPATPEHLASLPPPPVRTGVLPPMSPPPRPPRPPVTPVARGLLLVIGGAVVALLIVSGAVEFGTFVGHERVTETIAFRTPVRRVELSVDAGSEIEIRGSDRADIVGERRLLRNAEGPELVEHIEGGTLYISATCGGTVPLWCRASYTLDVPRGVSVDVSNQGGPISVEGVDGSVRVSSTAGEVIVSDVGGDVEAQSYAGAVEVVGGRGARVQAESTAGRVTVSNLVPPEQVTARSTAGRVAVEVPDDGTAYNVEAQASSGSGDVQVPIDPQSPRRIVADSSAGSAHVSHVSE